MDAPPKPEFETFLNGQKVRITYCPAVRGGRDLNFDRWSFDNAGQAPKLSRSEGLTLRSNWQSGDSVLVMGKNGRVRPKKAQ